MLSCQAQKVACFYENKYGRKEFQRQRGRYRLTFSCFEMVDPQIPILKEWD
jgi:hypothetical protein